MLRLKSYLLLGLMAMIFSCKKQSSVSDIQIKKNLVPEVCTIGMETMPGYKKPVPPPPPPPPPPPVDTTVTQNADTSYGVFLLDFDGYVVNSPVWNSGNPINCASAGVTDIPLIINTVINDYAPYRVIVTTDESIYYAAHTTKRMRAIITYSSGWYQGVSGVSYTGSLNWGDSTPCFIFTDRVGYDNHIVAEVVSHELGHTVGLSHQAKYSSTCSLIETYNSGDGINAPIMGLSYYATNGGSWWIGPTPNGCTTRQDDAWVHSQRLRLK